MAGPVDQDHPGATVGRVTLGGLVEDRCNDLLAVGGDRAGQPLRLGLGADPAAALAAAALGAGGGDTDDIVGAAGGRLGVVDHPKGGHPLASLLLATGQPRPVGVGALGLGRLQGRLAQRLGTHRHALAVHRHHQHGGVGARLGHHGAVERVDVGGGHGQLLDLPLAHHLPAAATDRLGGLVERAAHRLQGRQPAQPVAVAQPGQPQGRIGRVDNALPPRAPGTPTHRHRPKDGGQRSAVAGLDRVADAAVSADHRCPVCAHRLLLADLAQVEVVLEQLPQQIPAAHLQQVLQLGVPQPRGRLGAQLHGQGSKRSPGRGERIGRIGGGAGWHRLFSGWSSKELTGANATINRRQPINSSTRTWSSGHGGQTGPLPARPASHAAPAA